uniref:Uncharacterized protein n=1 Tax=Sparus aurata TaxID=8175 RepID=A0A671W6J8_SPAAU
SLFELLCLLMIVSSIGVRFARQEDPLPYMVSQPLPWQIHSVSHSRRGSKAEEVSSERHHQPYKKKTLNIKTWLSVMKDATLMSLVKGERKPH